jgi:hypothetical protein
VTTLHLLIVCGTLLALAVLAFRALADRETRRAQAARETAMHERAAAAPTRELAEAIERLSSVAAALEQRPAVGPSRLGRRVTVHTKPPADQTLYGLVTGDYADRLVLEDAEFVTAQGGQPLPGRQDIDRADIAWVDVHAHVARDTAPVE